MAAQFAADGHRVTVLTAMPSFPSGVIAEGYRGRRLAREWDGAVEVVRVWTYTATRLRRGARVLNWLSVALGASLQLFDPRRRADLVIVSSPPLTLALPALLAKLLYGATLIFDVRDLWPELGIASGVWRRESLTARGVGALADLVYRLAALVVPVTRSGAEEIVARGVPAEKIFLAPNGFDAIEPSPEFVPPPANGGVRVAYIGNMGLANGLDVVLDAALLLRDDPRLRFYLVGDGLDGPRLRERIANEGIANVEMPGVLTRGDALKMLASVEICLVTLRASIRDSLPTKLIDALYLGTPVVVSAAGEARRFVEASGGGLAVEPEDAAQLANALRALADDEAARREFASRGRAFVREDYDRARIMERLASKAVALTSRYQAAVE